MGMKEEIVQLPLEQIKELYTPYITKVYREKMHNMSELTLFDLLLPVEENQGTYILVGGYEKYNYLVDHKITTASCIIEKQTDPIEQHFKILRRLYNKGDSWEPNNKKKVLSYLTASGVTINTIINRSGMNKKEIDNYNLSSEVPENYHHDHATIPTLNYIARLPFSEEAKHYLYERVGEAVGSPTRVTTEKLKSVEMIAKNKSIRPKFEQIPVEQQINVIKRCISLKSEFAEIIEKMIEQET